MSNYKFKGTSISTITNTTSGANATVGNYFTGFPPTLATTFSMMRPLDLNYTITSSSTDVSNSCTASYTDYTGPGGLVPLGVNIGGSTGNVYLTSYDTETTITPPTNAKQMRYILVGGGGSGGGYGGDAIAKDNVPPDSTAIGNGGLGGTGSYSSYVISSNNILITTPFNIKIGSGGTQVSNGANESKSVNAVGAKRESNGGRGSTGASGNNTTLKVGLNTYTSIGGTGGAFGNGGSATADSSNTDSNPGNTDTALRCISNQSIPSNCPPCISNYIFGAGGSGGVNSTLTSGATGNPGICRIIWLYD